MIMKQLILYKGIIEMCSLFNAVIGFLIYQMGQRLHIDKYVRLQKLRCLTNVC